MSKPKHSHHFTTGHFKKKKLKHSELYHAMLSATPQQRSYIKEHVRQSLGERPSRHWGHKQIPDELFVKAPRNTLEKMRGVEDLPNHAFAEHVSSDKDASGYFSAVVETVGKNIKTAVDYGIDAASSVASFVASNRQLIGTVVQTVSDVAQGVSAVGGALGWFDEDTSTGIQDFAKGLGDFGKTNFGKRKQVHVQVKPKSGSGQMYRKNLFL